MLINRRKVVTSLTSATCAAAAAPWLARRGYAATPLHTLKFVYPDTPSHPFMQVARRFAEKVRRKTDGAVEVQVFTTGQLGTQANMLTSLQTGIVDLCAHTSGFLQTIHQPVMVLDLPFLFPDSGSAERVLDGPSGTRILEALTPKGIYGLSYGHFGWRVVLTVGRDVPSPSDVKGLKIRVQPGAIIVSTFKELAAIPISIDLSEVYLARSSASTLRPAPISIDLSEVYLALSQRAIEAVETPMISIGASKHDEVVKSVNLTDQVYNPGIMMASKRKLDALPKPYQGAIREASVEMMPDWRSTIADASRAAQDRFAGEGLRVVTVDRPAYRAAVQPVYERFRDTIGAELMDGVLKQVG